MMTPMHKTKDAESSQLSKDYQEWLKAGHRPTILPSPGDGHVLTNTYSLRHNDAASAIKAGAK